MTAQGNAPGTGYASVWSPNGAKQQAINSRQAWATPCDAPTGLLLPMLTTQGVGRQGSRCPGLSYFGPLGLSIGSLRRTVSLKLTPMREAGLRINFKERGLQSPF